MSAISYHLQKHSVSVAVKNIVDVSANEPNLDEWAVV